MLVRSGVLISPSTIWRALHDQLDYRLLAVAERAKEMNETERAEFTEALTIILEHPEMAIWIDETHKDRNSSRRRKAWGRRGRKLEL